MLSWKHSWNGFHCHFIIKIILFHHLICPNKLYLSIKNKTVICKKHLYKIIKKEGWGKKNIILNKKQKNAKKWSEKVSIKPFNPATDISVNVMFETPSAVNKPNDSAHIQRAREKNDCKWTPNKRANSSSFDWRNGIYFLKAGESLRMVISLRHKRRLNPILKYGSSSNEKSKPVSLAAERFLTLMLGWERGRCGHW